MAAKFPDDQLSLTGSHSSDDTLNCAICTEPFKNPKVLPCHHTFCTQCLEQYFITYQRDSTQPAGTFPCPVCRQIVKIPDGDLETLSKNTHTDHIQDLVSKIASHKKINCDVCKYRKQEISAKNHCRICSINYCEHCSKDHDQHNLFQTHSVIPVTLVENSFLKCDIHDAENVKYYCITCMTPMCTVCAVTDHNGHKTMDMVTALGNKKEDIIQNISNMSERVKQQEDMMAQLEDIQNVQDAATKKTKLEIERHVNGLIGQLHARKQVLLENVEKSNDAVVKQINLEKENCAFQLANMKSLWKFAAKLTEPSQALQLLAMHSDLQQMVRGLQNSTKLQIPKECITMNMFVPKDNIAVGSLQSCELSSSLLARISKLEVSNGVDSRPTSPSQQFYEPMTIKWQNPRLVWKIDKIGQKNGEINEVYDVAITPNGNVIIAEWLNQRLQVFDSTGYCREIIGQGSVQPWGVALTKEGNLATTCEKDRCVKLFSQRGRLLVSWKKCTFGWPRGIVVNNTGQYIVTDTQHGKHTVSIHLPDGQCIRQFGSQGSGNEQFHWPRYVTVDTQDRIIVADSSNHCVKVFDPTGQFMFKFGSIGSGDGQLKHPRGVCVEPNNNILVADQDNNRVCLFGSDGKFIRHILSVQRPWGIALSEGGLLAITQKPAVLLYKVFDPMP